MLFTSVFLYTGRSSSKSHDIHMPQMPARAVALHLASVGSTPLALASWHRSRLQFPPETTKPSVDWTKTVALQLWWNCRVKNEGMDSHGWYYQTSFQRDRPAVLKSDVPHPETVGTASSGPEAKFQLGHVQTEGCCHYRFIFQDQLPCTQRHLCYQGLLARFPCFNKDSWHLQGWWLVGPF